MKLKDASLPPASRCDHGVDWADACAKCERISDEEFEARMRERREMRGMGSPPERPR